MTHHDQHRQKTTSILQYGYHYIGTNPYQVLHLNPSLSLSPDASVFKHTSLSECLSVRSACLFVSFVSLISICRPAWLGNDLRLTVWYRDKPAMTSSRGLSPRQPCLSGSVALITALGQTHTDFHSRSVAPSATFIWQCVS